MRRFEIQSTLEGSAGEPIGEGVEFANQVVAVNWPRPFSASIEVFAGGMDALALHIPTAEIVWLDKPEALAPQPCEEEHGRHAQPADLLEVQAIEHLTKEVWDGQPLPAVLTPPTDGPPKPPTEMWPAKGQFIYSVNGGGLMRCCLESLDVYMQTRRDEGCDSDGDDADIVDCRHCDSSMIRVDGIWKWNRP